MSAPEIDEPAREEPDEADGPIELVVPPELAGERLDRALTSLVPGTTRAALQRWIEDGRVLVDGATARSSTRVRAGVVLLVTPAPPLPSDAEPEDIPLVVLFEDEHLVVIDKPAGLVVHPAPGHPSGTLVNALLHRYGGLPGEARRPGIVHRIDKDTSGILVVARSDAAREGLMRLFAAHHVERTYLAIAVGDAPVRATYDTLHGRHPTDRKRFSTRVTRGRHAVTHVERVESLHGASLLSCRLETGRTHQIRVHLAEHGLPILGDALYGKAPKDPRLAAAAAGLGRQALHAAVLGFRHPVTGRSHRWESPLPADFAAARAALRS